VCLAIAACASARVTPGVAFDAIDYGAPTEKRRVAGHDVAYVDLGPRDASALVFLHPWGGSASYWRHVWPAFTDRYRVIAIDAPGHGKSARPPRASYTPWMMARVTVHLLDALGVSRATFIGNSMGGATSLATALQSPDRVERLVLIDAAGAWAVPEPLHRLARAVVHPKTLATVSFEAVEALFRLGIFFGSTPPDAARHIDEMLSVRGTADHAAWAHAVTRALDAVARFDVTARLPEIRVPVLVLWGEWDVVLPAFVAERLAQALPDARLAIIPDCGHMPQLEAPEDTARLIAAFLDETRATDR
jgi:pimeloyl-ACP methyl ester carboxylesterase